MLMRVAARRAGSTTASTAAAAAGYNGAAVGLGEENGYATRRVFTQAFFALYRLISILHRTQGIEVVTAVFAVVLINWHIYSPT
jgi:hypothetical protein